MYSSVVRAAKAQSSALRRSLLSAVAAAAVFGVSSRAWAGNLTIIPDFDQTSVLNATDSANFQAAINADIAATEKYIDTRVPVTIHIGFYENNEGLGGSGAYSGELSYSSYLADLKSNPTKTALATAAIATMPAGPGTGINNNATTMNLLPAHLLAIGETALGNQIYALGGNAGNIYLNESIINDTRTNIDPDKYDLRAVAQHEINEILGVGGQGTTLTDGTIGPDIGSLDLFRYSAPGVRSFTNSSTASSYFSVDGGVTNLDNFNQDGGGDYADWGTNAHPQVQDAFSTPGVDGQVDLDAAEIASFDVAGYVLTPAGVALETATPEPTTLGFLAFGAFCVLARRRRSTI